MGKPRKSRFCETCNQTFTSPFSLRQHTKVVHLGERKFSCSFCPFRASNYSNLVNHVATHTKEKAFKCPKENCSYAASSKSLLKPHLRRMHPDENAPIPEDVRKPHKCPLCPFRTEVACRLDDHIRCHTGERPYLCTEPNCGLTFNCQSNLRGHLRVHLPDEVSRKYPCPIAGCPVRVKMLRDVKKHLLSHQTEKEVTCPIPGCGRQFKGMSHVKVHVKKFHSDEKPYVCTYEGCDYRSKYPHHLTIHVRVHTDEKPFKCPVEDCGHSSRNSSNLAQHMATHGSEKPVKCPVCNRGFDFKSRLMDHFQRTGHLSSAESTRNVNGESEPSGVTADVESSKSNLEIEAEKIKKTRKRATKILKNPVKSSSNAESKKRTVLGKKTRAKNVEDKTKSLYNNEYKNKRAPEKKTRAKNVKDKAKSLSNRGSKDETVTAKKTKDITAEKSKNAEQEVDQEKTDNNINKAADSNENPASSSQLTETSDENLVFQCTHCEFSTKHKTSLFRHKKSVHKVGQYRRHNCKFCGYSASHKHELIRHTRTHTGERPFPCGHPGCNYAAKQLTDLIRHRRCVHAKLKKHSCNLCDYRTGQKYHLSRHMLTHEENAAKLKFCDLCPYKTVLAENLRRHKITVHSTNRPFKCPHPDCDYAGKFEPALKGHLLSHRTDDSWKPAKCQWPGCSYRGRIPADIRNHMTVHTKEKPFKCTLCPKAYTAHTTLVSHMCSHTKEVHHRCSLCDYGAARSQDLKKHCAAYHSSPRGLDCPYDSCSFSGHSDGSLKFHLRVKHSIRKVKAEKKSTEFWETRGRKNKTQEKIDEQVSLKCRVTRCPIITTDGAAMASHLDIVHGLPRLVLDRIGLKI